MRIVHDATILPAHVMPQATCIFSPLCESYLQEVIRVMGRNLDRAENICDAAANDPVLLEEILVELGYFQDAAATEARKRQGGFVVCLGWRNDVASLSEDLC
jgi:hypothetical protein